MPEDLLRAVVPEGPQNVAGDELPTGSVVRGQDLQKTVIREPVQDTDVASASHILRE